MNQLSSYLSNISAEDKQLMREKAKETRKAKQEWAEANLKQDFLDLPYWRQLASEAGVRLPMSYVPAIEVKHVKKLLKKLNIDVKEWCEVEGYSTLKKFGVDNPTYPAYAHCGLVLEYWKENN